MGSRLRMPSVPEAQLKLDWDPDSNSVMFEWSRETIQRRRGIDVKIKKLSIILQPAVHLFTTFSDIPLGPLGVGTRSAIVSNLFLQAIASANNTTAEHLFIERGWAGISWKFYGDLLLFLELSLNLATPLLTVEDHPVYAFGYDWRQSNKVSGINLASFINDVLEKHPGRSR
jgi:hypothetical protein